MEKLVKRESELEEENDNDENNNGKIEEIGESVYNSDFEEVNDNQLIDT